MSGTRLLGAIRAVDTLLARELADAGAAPEVLRVDEAGADATTVEVQLSGERRWYSHGPDGTHRLDPRRDARLPFTHGLGDERLETLAYRPGRRWVVRRDATPDRVTKAFRRRRGAAAARRHELGVLLATQAGLKAARRIDFHPRAETLDLELLPGTSFRLGPPADEAVRAVGGHLRTLQELDAPTALDYFGPSDELEVLDHAADRVRRMRGVLPDGWARRRAELVAPGADETPAVACHRDLHDGQLLLLERGIALLDFDLLCRADGALDVGNFVAHLELRGLQRIRGADPESSADNAEAFLSGFDVERAPEVRTRLRFYRSTSLLRLSLVYALRPRWWQLSNELVARAGHAQGIVGALAP
jgi:hypothetical protein